MTVSLRTVENVVTEALPADWLSTDTMPEASGEAIGLTKLLSEGVTSAKLKFEFEPVVVQFNGPFEPTQVHPAVAEPVL